MRFRISQHAQDELKRRSIPAHVLESVLQAPEQVIETHGGKKAYQSRVDFSGNIFLVRVIVAEDVDPPLVVTVYRTSKIQKYWRPS